MTSAILQRWQLPQPRDLVESAKVDSSVAKYIVVCATVVVMGLIGGLVTVATTAGDVGAMAVAIGSVLTAMTTLLSGVLRRRSGGNASGETARDS